MTYVYNNKNQYLQDVFQEVSALPHDKGFIVPNNYNNNLSTEEKIGIFIISFFKKIVVYKESTTNTVEDEYVSYAVSPIKDVISNKKVFETWQEIGTKLESRKNHILGELARQSTGIRWLWNAILSFLNIKTAKDDLIEIKDKLFDLSQLHENKADESSDVVKKKSKEMILQINKLRDLETDLEGITSEFIEVNKKITKIKDSCTQYDIQKATVLSEIKNKNDLLEKSKIEKKELEKSIRFMSYEVELISSDTKEKLKELDSEVDVSKVAYVIDGLDRTKKEYQNDIRHEKKKLMHAEIKIFDLGDEISELKAKYDDIKCKLRKSTEELKSTMSSYSKLEKQIMNSKARIQEMKNTIECLAIEKTEDEDFNRAIHGNSFFQ